MYFSERYGYKEISEKINWENITERLRNRLWNIIYPLIEKEIITSQDISSLSSYVDISKNIKTLWEDFLARPIDFMENYSYHHVFRNRKVYNYDLKSAILDEIKNDFFSFKWFRVYDLIEFLHNKFLGKEERRTYAKEINRILAEERAPYRLINGSITPLTDEEEIIELAKALNIPQDKYKSVKEHLEKALSLLSDREKPDYLNSIKESICALESLVQIFLGKKGTLGGLIKELNIHPALKEGFSNLYGWTSDAGGIRHAKFKESLEINIEEARYILITTSVFINYLIKKFSKDE